MLVTSNKMIIASDNKVRTQKPVFKLKKIGPGQFIKVEVKPTDNPAPEIKIDKTSADKVPDPDDFTVIKSVGYATQRALVAHKIFTYEDLMTAKIDFLPANVVKAIEEWRKSRG